MMTFEKLAKKIQTEKDQATEVLSNFRTSFDNAAVYAFEWAERPIEAAAAQAVAFELEAIVNHLSKRMTTNVEAETAMRAVCDEVLARVLQGARAPRHSTSAVSNLVYEARTAAWARWFETINREDYTISKVQR